MKVLVPFGTKIINGFVTKIINEYQDAYELKEIDSIVDKYLCLNKEMIELGSYLQQRTLCTKIAAYQTMLPSSLKVNNNSKDLSKYLIYIELIDDIDKINNYINKYPNRKKQVEVLKQLQQDKKILKNTISSNICNILLEENLIKITKEQIYRLNKNTINETKVTLTNEQENAIDRIDLNNNKTYLIHGVTGSGKTEVYMQLIENTVKNNKTAILLVPEITLTTQIVNRFYDRFGNDVAIFHSALSDGEKFDEYLKILRGEVHIVVGTRSAIFTPINNLGLIILDEEHSENFKQDTTPRYHALDIADYRAKYHNIPLVLGSATPSLESMARAKKGVYELIEMKSRVGSSVLPKVEIVDMVEEIKKRNIIFSESLLNKLNERLENNEQSIILLNRRGYSTIITCKACGYKYSCPHCDITLTYHKTSNNLRCHYCGYAVYKKDNCPSCNEQAITDYGLGTEKLELELKKKLPNARIIRMDADTTRNKGSHEDIINRFKNHEYDILLGTQMISKGLDFPLVTLVGIINADTTLNIPDFRSGERTFALLSQVAGRAGRGDKKGEVILQTYNKDNFTLNCVAEHNYDKFYDYEMSNRHKLDYPPYFYITSIKIASRDYDIASKEIMKVKKYLEKNISNKSIILGPTPASMFKLNNVYRFQILIKYKVDPALQKTLRELDEIYMLNNKANIEIDNNPLQV
jgi:primosomal protein N' (replication factor Y)